MPSTVTLYGSTPRHLIVRASLEDSPTAHKLLCESLGNNYVSMQKIQELIARQNVLLAKDATESTLIGVATCVNIAEHPDALNGIVFPDASAALKSLVVHESARGQGVGSALMRASVEVLRTKGHKKIASVSWRSGNVQSSESLFIKHGWQEERVVENLWTQASIKQGFHCPTCGNPCYCSGVLFVHEST